MNTIDDFEWVARLRATVPFPSQARLATGRARLLAAATGRGTTPHRRRVAGRPFPRWRPMVALAAAAAVAAGAGFALSASHPAASTAPTTRTATLQASLAARVLHVAAARLTREAEATEPSPGQWIYYNEVDESGPNSPATSEGPEWVTFDGDQSAYYEVGGPFIVHTSNSAVSPPGINPWVELNTYGISAKTAWDVLAALPADPHALLAVIARQAATSAGAQFAAASVTSVRSGVRPTEAQLEFAYLTRILWNAWLGGPPGALAAVYRAMATLPGITVQQGIADAAGTAVVGVSDDGGYHQLLLSPVTYQVVGWRAFSDGVAPAGRNGNPRERPGVRWPPKDTLLVSTALTQVAEVAAAGDR